MSDPTILQSPSNPTVKHLVRMRDNRARRKAGCVIVDGWRETAQAIAAGLILRSLYHTPLDPNESKDSSDYPWKRNVIDSHGMGGDGISDKTTLVSEAILQKIGYGQSARGVVAEFDRPEKSLDQLELDNDPLILVLDQMEKPGNVGAIFRSAEAAGVSAILLCGGGDPLHPNAIRSSSGGVFHVPWATATIEQMSDWLALKSVRVLASRVESSTAIWDIDWTGATAIVMGNEADGLRDRWQNVAGQAIQGVCIPMAGQVDSLNVSVAAALLAFTAINARKRQQA
ncbi:23S rRNA (uridine(2479)-2'-O)-methyltransferase [Rubripirellula obstinata]|uniref:23S rRNA (Uridine(2479)-2'-O)-methyltransferase n=1 Tax=Rubripirellula obstinata TaxID=406547 RepID=A0A5B1CI28_9BACT|nr:TrmH family RNA methyltransferase [Rubripirellula obstinata]KAA1259882.1 23S rRNA (uridine(2479)-2'-O)-methyltransferase [Rubripirellula obstinata]